MSDILDKTECLVNNMENLVTVVKPKVVVISRREGLLGRAVEYLTVDEKEWMILRAFDNQNILDLIQEVKRANPNIVIISQNERGNDERFSTQLLQACPELKKVILVSLSENLMEVYCKQKIQVKSTQDLFSEVENQFSII
jgi:hypothetical protein